MINRIVSGIVGRWMNRREKIAVKATDTLSIRQKNEEYEHLEFVIANMDMLAQLQAQSGVQMIPEDMAPKTKDELDLWASENQRLPEEILFETGINDSLSANGLFQSVKEQLLWDSATTGFVGTYTYMDSEGVVHEERVLPENAVYSYSTYNDFRDTSWRGRIVSPKISEIRKKYGVEFGGIVTEEQLFELAQQSKEYQVQDKITWLDQWNASFFRPYDEWNVDVLEVEFKSLDCEHYTQVTTKKNKSTILKKGAPTKKADNEEVIEDTNWNIYRGVYAKDANMLLEWKLKDNMIRPQDPKEIGNAEFSYSFYMYQNYNMRNVAIPEKIEEATNQMILALLKMQQVIAKMRPTGAAINADALREVDFGLGDQNKIIDPKKLYDQTGDIYYNGRDAEGNPIPAPISELKNSGFIDQMNGLIAIYQFHYQVLKDQLGEDPNLISSALQPRVTAGNVNTAQDVAANATDYMYSAYTEVISQTATKISCLLHKSVTYGARAYRNLLKQEDVENRIFGTAISMLPSDQEIMILDNKMNQAIASNPDLVMYLDTFKILRIARENVKLAEEYFRLSMKKMLESKIQQTQQNTQATIEGQIKSAQEAERSKQDTERLKGEIEIEGKRLTAEGQNKNAVITMIAELYKNGIPIPKEIQPLATSVINNIMLPLVAQTEGQMEQVEQTAVQEDIQAAEQQETMQPTPEPQMQTI
jgi:hypothetical protein